MSEKLRSTSSATGKVKGAKGQKKSVKGTKSSKKPVSSDRKPKSRSMADRMNTPVHGYSREDRAALEEAENPVVNDGFAIRNEADRQRFVAERNRMSNNFLSDNNKEGGHGALIGVLVAVLVTMAVMLIAVRLMTAGVLPGFFGIKKNDVRTSVDDYQSGSDVVTVTFDESSYQRLKELFGGNEEPEPEMETVSAEPVYALNEDGEPILGEDGEPIPVVEKDGYLFMKSPDGRHMFMQSPDGLYVTIDGIPYKVVDTGKDLKAVDDNDNVVDIESVDDSYDMTIKTDADGNRYYHIVWGDTLCKISSMTHYSVDELAEYNHIKNVNLIYAESDLRIPGMSFVTGTNDNGDIPALIKLDGDSEVETDAAD